MGKTEVEVTHPFLVYIRMEDQSFKQMMNICDSFDVWEVARSGGLKDTGGSNDGDLLTEETMKMIVDVMEVRKNEVVIKITPQKPMTYTGIYDCIQKLLNFVKERQPNDCFLQVDRIVWELDLFGIPSTIKKARKELRQIDKYRV